MEEQPQVKLCTACKWIVRHWPSEYCGHPSLLSPVDGKAHEFCSHERSDMVGKCRTEALLWEPREPLEKVKVKSPEKPPLEAQRPTLWRDLRLFAKDAWESFFGQK